jgi:RNA polymerase sigma factor (sigma-70 family)
MATSQLQRVVQHLRQTVRPRTGSGATDGQLMERFIARRDEEAFAAIVRRHGPMVLGVCRRLLPARHHDAEDAFQATFLVLVRKAASVVPREMLPNWLYGVAYHIALKARAVTARRQAKEKQVLEMPEPEVVSPDTGQELRPLLDQELSHLPDIYRVPIVCCDLEGKTRQEAARQLGWSEGTLSGRLSRARALLAKRLTRRGLVLSAGSLAAALSRETASAGVPYSLVISTVRAGSLFASGQAVVAGAISLKVAALTEGVLNAMWVTKLKIATAILVTVCAVGGGGGGFAYRMQAVAQAGGTTATITSDQAVAQPADNQKNGDVVQEPTEQERLEKLLKQLDEQIRKAQEQTEQERLERLLKQLEEQIRKAQAALQPADELRLQQAQKELEEALRKLSDQVETQKKVRAAAATAQREIDKILEGVRKANDKKAEIEILDEIEKAVKEMKRKAQGQPQEKQPEKSPRQ